MVCVGLILFCFAMIISLLTIIPINIWFSVIIIAIQVAIVIPAYIYTKQEMNQRKTQGVPGLSPAQIAGIALTICNTLLLVMVLVIRRDAIIAFIKQKSSGHQFPVHPSLRNQQWETGAPAWLTRRT